VGKPFTSQELWRCLMKYFTPENFGTGQKNMQLEAELVFQKSIHLLFLRDNMDKYSEIVKCLEAGDIITAYRLTHTLKSSAGQVGKILLQRAAANIEQQLKDGKNMVTEEQLKMLETELAVVLNEFSTMQEPQ